MAQHERPKTQNDQDRPMKPQPGMPAPQQDEDLELDEPTGQQQKKSTTGDEGCGCAG